MSKENNKENPNKIRTRYLINIIALCLITLLSVSACVFMLIRTHSQSEQLQTFYNEMDAAKGEQKTLFTEDELQEQLAEATEAAEKSEHGKVLQQIQSSLESGESTAVMLRKLFADDLVVVNGGKYYFYPVLDDVDKHRFKESDFAIDEAGRLSYVGANEKISLQQGVDLSENNGQVDFGRLSSNFSFAMISIGSRDNSGALIKDSMFDQNISGATANGMDVGVVFKLQASSEEEAIADANFVIDELSDQGTTINMPIAVSVNVPEEGSYPSGQTKKEWTNNVIAFCDTLDEAGYSTIIYGNIATFTIMLDMEQLENYDKWIANYDAKMYFPYQFKMWQYSTTGQVEGISGEASLDVRVVDGTTK